LPTQPTSPGEPGDRTTRNDSATGWGLSALPRNVWVVTLTSFLTDVSSEMIASLLPLYLSQVLGARTAAIGLIEGVAETTASLLKIVSGWLSDRLGKRKWLAVLGYAVSTAAKPFLLVAGSWVVVLGVRFMDRLGKGIRTAPRDALVADSTDPLRRGLAFGVHRAGDTAGAVVGLLVALVGVWALEGTSTRLTRPTFQLLVALCLVPAVLAVVVLAVFARETPRKGKPGPPPRFSLAPFDRRFKRFLLAMVVFTLGNSSDAFLILRARQVGLPVTGVLGMMLTFNIVYATVSIPAGALSDRLGRRRLILTGWLVYALIYLGFAWVTTGVQAWALMTVYGLFYGLTDGNARAYVADLVASGERGTAYGVYNAAVGFAALPASLIAGLLWQGIGPWSGFGPEAPFYFGGAMALVAVVLFTATIPPKPGPVTDNSASS
jgi:MFS family permease